MEVQSDIKQTWICTASTCSRWVHSLLWG